MVYIWNDYILEFTVTLFVSPHTNWVWQGPHLQGERDGKGAQQVLGTKVQHLTLMKPIKNEGWYNIGNITLPVTISSKTTIFHSNENYMHEACPLYLLLLTDGRSNTCFMPAAWLVWNLRFWAVSDIHGESNCVVSWSTRWVYLVRPLRPKFFTCITFGRMVLSKWSSSVAAEKSLLYKSSSSFCKYTQHVSQQGDGSLNWQPQWQAKHTLHSYWYLYNSPWRKRRDDSTSAGTCICTLLLC